MLFKYQSADEEMAKEFEKSINEIDLDAKLYSEKKTIEAVNYLNSAAEKLEQFNLIKEAEIITKLAEVVVDNYIKIHEGPEDYKRENLEDEYLDEILDELNKQDDEIIMD